MASLWTTAVAAQQAGGIRGMVYDKDFEAPIGAAQVSIVETGQSAETTDEGNYVLPQVEPGTYTLVFSKAGYARQVTGDVVVSAGQLAEVDAWLAGEFTEMEEFIVQDVQLGGASELALLDLRMQSPALLDAISADLMSQAGAGDAASALRLVVGTSVQDGKYAVIRGLPDRYVNSQLNGIRLPTADEDKRAVQLDQFPAAAIESIQVSKTFTPDQQGDASGGAVNVVLRGIPDETVLKLSSQVSYNTQVTGRDDFLSYKGGGLDAWGDDRRAIQYGKLGRSWDGAVGVSETDAPTDYKFSLTSGGKYEFADGWKIGSLGSFFYERDSAFYEDGIQDKYWVERPGDPMTPQYGQGTPSQGDFKTELFDVTQGREELKWGGLGVVGLENDRHALTLTYLYTRVAEDSATLAEDTRGKTFYFPDYDRDDPTHPGNQERDAAPYLRTETLQYTERTTETLQLAGRHEFDEPGLELGGFLTVLGPGLEWGVAHSSAGLYQPDKRQFGSLWWAESYDPGYPPYVPPSLDPEVHRPYKPAANFTVGNLQRIWKDIAEESDQYFIDLKLPFEQWSGDEGYLKIGFFNDDVTRDYNQESFSNFNDNQAHYYGPYEDLWSAQFPAENHPITAAAIDVDYRGEQQITAHYVMAEVPLSSAVTVVGGARFESTGLTIVNYPEEDVTWIPPGAPGQVDLPPGAADVYFDQEDILPSIGFVFTPIEEVKLRASYSETVARQTFKELTPIQQQEFLGGDVFIGNPFLKMSSLKNYDLRCDYAPYEGGLVSLSYFLKDVKDPIEYVQRIADFPYITPQNYPEGELSGIEVEFRQRMGRVWDRLEGLTLVANATFIDSQVTLPDEEAELFEQPNIDAPMRTRDMTNAPEHLYNLMVTWDLTEWGLSGTELGLFYTVKGDTLVAGAGQSKGNFVPSVYETEYGTLNLSVAQKIGEHCELKFQAKNLTDPDIETVYRSEYIGDDVTRSSYRRGIEFSLGLSASF